MNEPLSIIHGKHAKSAVEKTAKVIFTVCAFFAILAVFSITLYMIVNGTPAIFQVGLGEILFGTVWEPTAEEPAFGILFIILTSIVGTFLAILIGVPIGVLTAVFLAEVAPKKLAAIVKPAVELLAGIPSVIYGLLGIMILNPLMYKLELAIFKGSETHQFTGGANLISAVIVLAIMILPTVINISESALKAVPPQYKSASLALGASHIQTIFKVMIPAAKSGIVTAIVGIRKLGQLPASVQLRPFPDHGHRQRDGLCVRPAQTGAVYHRSGAVRIHHGHQRMPDQYPQVRRSGGSGKKESREAGKGSREACA